MCNNFWSKTFFYKVSNIYLKFPKSSKNLNNLNNFILLNLNPIKLFIKSKKRKIKIKKFLLRGAKGVLKKKSTNILYLFRFNFLFNSSLVLTPVLNTFLSLYGINSQKFLEEFKNFKLNYFDNLSINLFLLIFKDCSFRLFLGSFKFGFFLQSLNLMSFYKFFTIDYCIDNFLFLHKTLYHNYIYEGDTFFIKSYSIYDFWFFINLFSILQSKLKFQDLFYRYYIDNYLKIIYSNFFSFFKVLKLRLILFKLKG